MGCDIHPYIEYTVKGYIKDEVRVEHFAVLNGERDYTLFAALTDGEIRGIDGVGAVPKPKGLPDDLSWRVFDEATLFVSERNDADDSEHSTSLSMAREWTSGSRYGHVSSQWVSGGYAKLEVYDAKKHGELVDGRPKDKSFRWITHPDWHTHSWLNADELEDAIESYPEIQRKNWGEDSISKPHAEVYGWLAAMRALDESDGVIASRLVIWFDN